MTESLKPTLGTLRLYACGGGGINIGQLFEPNRGGPEKGFADIDIVYVDTSRSNLTGKVSAEHFYLIEGMDGYALDGSGKVRAENHPAIVAHTLPILQKYPEGEINVVLHMAAGGSGSVIGPSLVSELIQRGAPVVVVTIGSDDTALDCANTLKTLKSYEGIAQARKAGVVVSYAQNSASLPRGQANKIAFQLISCLAVLYSRQNRELDSKDLFNFLRFDRVTSFKPQVAALMMIDPSSDDTGADLGNKISVATLTSDEVPSVLSPRPEYQCVGYVESGVVGGELPLHFVVCDGIIAEAALGLNKTIKELEQGRQARIKKGGLLASIDVPTETGLVI